MELLRQIYPTIGLAVLCGLFGKSRQAYYELEKRRENRIMEHLIVLDLVEQIRRDMPRIGTPKLHHMLHEPFSQHNIKMGRDALNELLAAHGMLIRKKRRRCKSNRSAKVFHEKFKELLDQFTINGNLIKPIREQLYFRVDQLTQDNRNQEKLLKKRLKEIETKIAKAQEKHFLGEIDSGVYQKFMPKYKQEKSQILVEIQKLGAKSSNLDKFIDKFLEMLPELPNLWDSGTLKAREHLQHLVFPEGIFYDRKSDEVRTSRINTLFVLTKRISDIYAEMKKGHFENFDETSLYVGAAGFEPAAPCSQSRCANRTAPRPEIECECEFECYFVLRKRERSIFEISS